VSLSHITLKEAKWEAGVVMQPDRGRAGKLLPYAFDSVVGVFPTFGGFDWDDRERKRENDGGIGTDQDSKVCHGRPL
jgi:hypothetical protein